jgi:hypothetical protein
LMSGNIGGGVLTIICFSIIYWIYSSYNRIDPKPPV